MLAYAPPEFGPVLTAPPQIVLTVPPQIFGPAPYCSPLQIFRPWDAPDLYTVQLPLAYSPYHGLRTPKESFSMINRGDKFWGIRGNFGFCHGKMYLIFRSSTYIPNMAIKNLGNSHHMSVVGALNCDLSEWVGHHKNSILRNGCGFLTNDYFSLL